VSNMKGGLLMRHFLLPLCWFNRHVPQRRNAHWDGFNYTSNCKTCGRKIRRREGGGWVKDWLEGKINP